MFNPTGLLLSQYTGAEVGGDSALFLKYSSGQSHFSITNVKLPEQNKYATHFVQTIFRNARK